MPTQHTDPNIENRDTTDPLEQWSDDQLAELLRRRGNLVVMTGIGALVDTTRNPDRMAHLSPALDSVVARFIAEQAETMEDKAYALLHAEAEDHFRSQSHELFRLSIEALKAAGYQVDRDTDGGPIRWNVIAPDGRFYGLEFSEAAVWYRHVLPDVRGTSVDHALLPQLIDEAAAKELVVNVAAFQERLREYETHVIEPLGSNAGADEDDLDEAPGL